MSRKPVSQELEEYLNKIKSKQIKEYALTELSDIIDEIVVKYNSTRVKEEKLVLSAIYKKIVEWYNYKSGKQMYYKEIKTD